MRQWLGVLGELHRIVGAQRTDAGDDRDMTRGFLHRSFDSAASFVASQIHINAGAPSRPMESTSAAINRLTSFRSASTSTRPE